METHRDLATSLDLLQGKAASADALINRIARDQINPEPGKLMTFQNAPDNPVTRHALLTVNGVESLPAGVVNSVVHNIKNPHETLETLGMAAAMGVVLKTVLPEGGMAGKVAGGLIGVYFTYKAAEPIFDSYKQAHHASTLKELDHATKQFADAGGSFIVNSAIAAVGYKIGSHATDRVLTSKSFDGFADAKANFYSKLSQTGGRLLENMGVTTSPAKTAEIAASGTGKIGSRVRLNGSERQAPEGTAKGDVDPSTPMEVTVMLKSQASDLRMDRTLARIAQGRQAPLTEAEFAHQFGAKQESLSAVTKFANEFGLQVSESNLTSGRVVLSGKAGDFSSAFETRLAQYESSGQLFRGRVGSLSVPQELAKHITGILGTDDRPQARNHAVRFVEARDPSPAPPEAPKDPHARKAGMYPDEVADAYNFPKGKTGEGQAVAIIELGGGLDKAENSKYYKNNSLPEPKINVIEVGGAKSKPGVDSVADAEVHLDSQIIGVVAPKATQHLIFAPNSDKGFIDAITRATFPEKGEMPSSAISISWGAPEELWTKQGMEGMSAAFKKAALRGISIFAASGDDGALDRSRSNTWQVDFPASDPSVTGTGGTRLTVKDGAIHSEVAWNNGRANDAGGGGVSQVFQLPEFQKNSKVPPNANPGGQVGRGVPDIAGNADPQTGYNIRVPGSDVVIAGTSAVAPLYAALTMRLNEALGKPVGNLNPWLYNNTHIFNDITVGHNNGYRTAPGWDPVTGLGSVDGTKMLAALQANPNTIAKFGQFRFVGPSTVTQPVQIDKSK